jgi:hypothetical protein
MSGNFGTPRPQPLPLSQAPVHKVTEWRTIQKYHFFEGLSGIIIEILLSDSSIACTGQRFFFIFVMRHGWLTNP